MNRLIGPYESIEVLASGAASTVIKARAPGGSVVALKVLRDASPEQRAAFAREVRLLRMFGEEDGFVPVLDAGEVPEGPYLVMPFLEGGTLRARLSRGPLPVPDAVDLVRELAASLALAHDKGIVHRDLKPENVVFTADGRPLVADLGVAKHFDRSAPGASQSAHLSTSGNFKGTAGYMAPEQMADATSVGPEADVFALGAILYECLAGQPAFQGVTPLDVITAVVEGRVKPLERVAEVPRWLSEIVAKALEKDPDLRFEDGEALRAALESPRKSSGKRTLVFALSVAVVFACGAVALGASLRGSSPPSLPLPLPLPSPSLPSTPTPPPPPAPLASNLELKPDSKLASELFEQARADQRRGDEDSAFANYSKAIEADPKHAPAWNNRGLIKKRRKDLAGALEDYTRAIEADPKISPAWFNRAELKEKKGDLRGAMDDYTQAIEADPKNAGAYSQRGLLKSHFGDDAGAYEDYSLAIEADPKYAPAYSNRGLVKSARNDDTGAMEDYAKAIDADPKLAAAWNNRGLIKRRRGDEAGALADFEKAIEADSRHAPALVNRGAIKKKRGDEQGAFEDFERAIASDPTNAPAFTNRGMIKGRRGDDAGAIEDHTRAIAADPRCVPAWVNRGIVKQKRGEKESALADFEKALTLGVSAGEAKSVKERIATLRKELGR